MICDGLVVTQQFVQTIEDEGLVPIGLPVVIDSYTTQHYLSKNNTKRVPIVISREHMTISEAKGKLMQLELSRLIPRLFPTTADKARLN